jgi:2-dehydro-3-deoxyphosphogluconate aldolase / (4S)-4-hydroxy-2-oxoglutarate aldolase
MNEVISRLSDTGIIPVVKIDDADKAIPLAKALYEGGLSCIEITFRTSQAEEAIRRITSALPCMLVGAGTVLTTDQVDKASAAGAKFIVSPGINPAIVKYCTDRQIPITPGCSNPTDIEAAIGLGLDVVKFFPAEAMGGTKVIRAISAPYGGIKFIPTGGINEKNIVEYLTCPSVLACGGSWMVSDALIKSGDFNKITALTQEAVKIMLGFELTHIGINSENPEQAAEIAKIFCTLLGFDYKEGNSSIFAGKAFEIMKTPFRGKNGHIAIATNCINKAVAHMQSKGYKMDISSAKKDSHGNYAAVYFEQEFAGFALHLVQKG